MGHYLPVFRLVKAPQGLRWRQITWKRLPLLSLPHISKNLNYCSGPLRGELFHVVIQLLSPHHVAEFLPAENISHDIQIILVVHREAAGELELVDPQHSTSLSHFCWLTDCVLVLRGLFSITLWRAQNTGLSESAPWRVPNLTRLLRNVWVGIPPWGFSKGQNSPCPLPTRPVFGLHLRDSESTMILGLRKEFPSVFFFSFLFFLSSICSHCFACFSFSDKYGY